MWGWLTPPERWPRPRAWLERIMSAEAREEHARYEAEVNATPYQSNPEIEWSDRVGALSSWAADWLPGQEPPEDVKEYRRRRRFDI